MKKNLLQSGLHRCSLYLLQYPCLRFLLFISLLEHPLYLYTSPAVSSYKMSDEQLDAMRESLGLNGNVAERYVSWAGKMLQGDWGLSVSNHQPVKKQIMDKLPNTIGLMGSSVGTVNPVIYTTWTFSRIL